MLESGEDEEAGDREADPPGQWDVLEPDAYCEAQREQHPGVPLYESLPMMLAAFSIKLIGLYAMKRGVV